MIYTRKISAALIVAAMLALPTVAHADCFADYKAKRSNGDLQLHYGVIALPQKACDKPKGAKKLIEKRIAGDGWQLLRVMSSFDETGLNSRQANAGEYFLRY